MKETEVHCDHIPALGGMAVVCHIPYNVPAKLYHKERNPPTSWFYDYQGLFKLHSLSVVGDAQKRYGRPVPS